jgi:hypothetical protein
MNKQLVTEHFVPEQFELSVLAESFTLDNEVAAKIANTIWAHDRPGRAGNYSLEPFQVDPTGGEGNSHAPYHEGDAKIPYYLASFDGVTSWTPNNAANGLFGRAVQQALDDGERRNRMDAKGTTLFMATPTIISSGLEALAINTHDYAAELIVGVYGGGFTLAMIVMGGYNAYRRAITNPNFVPLNERHLRAAAAHAAKLALPPVVLFR